MVAVTGGSRGIGAATAILLARQGWDVCIGFRASAEPARQVVAACEAAGVAAIAVPADVTSPDAVAALFTATDAMGPVVALVNNAGIIAGPARVEEMTHDRLVAMFAVNLYGSVRSHTSDPRRMRTQDHAHCQNRT